MASAPTFETLLYAVEDGVATVTLNRPEKLNAFNTQMMKDLIAAFDETDRDDAVRAVIVTGAGRAFCAGADLKAAGTPEALQDGPNGDWTLRDMQKAMRACPQPIIALVRGAAAGGGLTIALAADVVVASESAIFHPAFMAIGLSGAELGVSWRLQRAIGVSRARQMLLAGRPLNAEAALASGMVAAVTPEAELDAYGEALAADMLKARPDALRLTKRSLDAALESPSLEVAYELEERAQMLMIARRGA
jgi:enoyl-CoA hydratase/carnithine racemase